MPNSFLDKLLQGEIVFESNDVNSRYDLHLFSHWLIDIDELKTLEIMKLEIKARLYRLALNTVSNDQYISSTLTPINISKVEKMAMYIAQNYGSKITASKIGEVVDLHPDYANNLFKKTFGSTLSEYIIEERITNAQRKLLSTDQSISEIAYSCGFNSISWFNTTFKKNTGCTPREYKPLIAKSPCTESVGFKPSTATNKDK